MGSSAGRSRNAPRRATARRRFDDDERAGLVHLYDDPQAWPDEHDRSQQRRDRIWMIVSGGIFVAAVVVWWFWGV